MLYYLKETQAKTSRTSSNESKKEKSLRLLGLNNVSTLGLNSVITSRSGNSLGHVYENVFKGFSASIDHQTLQDLENNPEVESIQKSYKVIPVSTQSPTPSWGLDRVDEKDRVLNQQYNYTGKGVHVYVLDSGINYN